MPSSSESRPLSLVSGQYHPQTNSRFFSLPAEIRNEIYTLVFSTTTLQVDSNPKQSTTQRSRPDEDPPLSSNHRLILACKQTHSEALGLYYSNTTFYFADHGAPRNWLAHLDQNRRDLIILIRISTNHPFDCPILWISRKRPEEESVGLLLGLIQGWAEVFFALVRGTVREIDSARPEKELWPVRERARFEIGMFVGGGEYVWTEDPMGAVRERLVRALEEGMLGLEGEEWKREYGI